MAVLASRTYPTQRFNSGRPNISVLVLEQFGGRENGCHTDLPQGRSSGPPSLSICVAKKSCDGGNGAGPIFPKAAAAELQPTNPCL